MKTKSSLAFLIGLLISQLALAQSDSCENGWCWGENPGTSKEKWVLHSDAVKMKDYETAISALDWLLENTPNLNKSLYISGVQLYEDLLDKEENGGKDAGTIEAYQDKVMALYDMRIEYFGEEADVLERKGRKAYYYWKDRDDPQKYNKMYDLYNKIFELSDGNVSGSNATFLMISIVNLKAKKDLTEEEVLSEYEKISEAIDNNIKTTEGETRDRWERIQSSIDDLLTKVVNIDCDFVRERMGDNIRNKPDDIKTSKKAIKYMLTGKCTDDPLFLKAAENVYEVEPQGSLANIIAKIYQSQKEVDKAISWKEKAIELSAGDDEKIGQYHYDIAQMLSSQGKRNEARQRAFKSAELNKELTSSAYTLVGDLYFNSASLCSDPNPVKAKANYLAAYDMYQKAGNSSRMSSAAQGFPTIEEIFTHNMKEGESVEVPCWIGGSVTIKQRPKDSN